jgi:hypothetical protein
MMFLNQSRCSRLGDTPAETPAAPATNIGDYVTKATDWLKTQPWYVVAALTAGVSYFALKGKGR